MFAEFGFTTFEADDKLKLAATVQLKIKMEVDQDKVIIAGGVGGKQSDKSTNLKSKIP